ncbi:uncharacterized protein LOC109118475 [Fukomys damarensis]|uniref:uncharacterized protein LOC109118475 n=1 Tax=Fukomys damarensis TaxID=885580 RepID=UPI001455825A|nr:uncharacterized protein LOC109118475 [Fukomys damarensis]
MEEVIGNISAGAFYIGLHIPKDAFQAGIKERSAEGQKSSLGYSRKKGPVIIKSKRFLSGTPALEVGFGAWLQETLIRLETRQARVRPLEARPCRPLPPAAGDAAGLRHRHIWKAWRPRSTPIFGREGEKKTSSFCATKPRRERPQRSQLLLHTWRSLLLPLGGALKGRTGFGVCGALGCQLNNAPPLRLKVWDLRAEISMNFCPQRATRAGTNPDTFELSALAIVPSNFHVLLSLILSITIRVSLVEP